MTSVSVLCVNSLCVSQLSARCLCVLLGPVVATHTPPARAGTVHLQDAPTCHQAHCREGTDKETDKRLSFQPFVSEREPERERENRSFVLPGKVVLTLKFDTQVTSSSPPVQSSFPSQV